MKKKIIVLALIVTLSLCSGCGKKIPTLSNGDEAVVTLKDGSMISVNELYEAVKDDYALSAMIDLVDKKILEDKYADKLEDANKYAQGQLETLESYYGDELDSLVQQNGYANAEAYRDKYIYLSYIKDLAVKDYAKAQITEKEVENYYKSDIVGDIKISHILITPEVTDDMTDEEKTKAETEAKEKAEAIITELKKTEKSAVADKFAQLASEQSMDEASKDNGGSLGFINKSTLSSQYAAVSKAAYELKDGEYSKTVVQSEIGYHVLLRVETKEKAPLEDVRDDILTTLGDKYLKDHLVAYLDGLLEIRKEYKFEIVDSELQSQYTNYISRQRLQYEEQQKQQNEGTTQANS